MGEDQSKIEIVQEHSPKPILRELSAIVRQSYETERSFFRSQAEKLSAPMPESLRSCLVDVSEAYKKYYIDLGIDLDKAGLTLPQDLFLLNLDQDIGFQAVTSKGIVLVGVPTHFTLPQSMGSIDQAALDRIKEAYAAKVFTHEIYHGIPKTVMSIDSTGKTSSLKRGLIYSDRQGNEGNALEEGLAVVRTETVAQPTLNQSYEDELQLFDQMRSVMETSYQGLYPLESIHFRPTSKAGLEPEILYPNSVKLVKFLQEEVPNFDRLAERSRLLGESVAFAKALEKRFGKGSYRRIVMSTEATASDTFDILNT